MLKNEIEMLISEKELSIKALKWILCLLKKESKNFEELVFQKYIETARVSDVASILNESGYRTAGAIGERKYTSNDVTEILYREECKLCVDSMLYEVAIYLNVSKYKTWEDKIVYVYKKLIEAEKINIDT